MGKFIIVSTIFKKVKKKKKESMEEDGRGMDHEGPCLKNLLFNAQTSGRLLRTRGIYAFIIMIDLTNQFNQ